jgi:hypothetical protein
VVEQLRRDVFVEDPVDVRVLGLDVLGHPRRLDVDGREHRPEHRDEARHAVDDAEVDHRHSGLHRQS